MAFVVVYDACVLYPAPLRDLLVRLAATDLVRARWTDQILDECFRNILANRPELRPEALSRTRHVTRALRQRGPRASRPRDVTPCLPVVDDQASWPA